MDAESELEDGRIQEPTKIWNVMFISIFFANMAMNLGMYMSNSILAIYADSLGATATQIGMLISTFAITSMSFRVISAPAMDTYNRKYIVIVAMLILSAAFFGFSVSKSIPSLMAFRLLQGCGMAFGNACCLAMVSETLPKDKYGTGIGYYSLAQVVSQVIGPTVGLWLVKTFGYGFTFATNACITLVAVFLTLKIRIRFKRTKKFRISLNNFIAKEALLPAVVQLFLIMAFCVVNSFLIVFASKQGVTENIGLYFAVSAVTMLFTRPAVGRLTDKYGLVKVSVPALFFDVVAFFIISCSHSLAVLLFAAFISAFGFGACQPALQTLTMKCVNNERRGAGSTTNFLAMDLGALIGPTVAGSIAHYFGYVTMWRVMVAPFLIAIALVFIFRGKIARIEKDFIAPD
jgi:MFS family permease